jgi:crossover junction endodeoxyribonuclease RuvC
VNFIGIDPGLSGAIAVWPENGEPVVNDMPTFEITVNGKKKTQIDLAQLARTTPQSWQSWHAFIENPGAMPGNGAVSMFNFGFACGVAQMAVAAAGIPYTLVKPAIWKRALGLTADKDASRQLASRLFPQSAHLWARKKDDGRAEAVLLAYYGSKVL